MGRPQEQQISPTFSPVTPPALQESQLLDQVLRQTEEVLRAWEDGDHPGTIDPAPFVALARGVQQVQGRLEDAIEELVRLATPGWVRSLVADEAAWRVLTADIACLLRADPRAYARVQKLWEQLSELA
jgi:hypothetical protein